jgi:hypothetical protein
MRMNLIDSQQALSFLVQQASIIEPEVYRIQYPDIQYSQLIPVDTTGNEWAKSLHAGGDWFHDPDSRPEPDHGTR